MSLPIFQSTNRDLMMMQTRWASELNPVLVNPALQVSLLKNVLLTNGTTVINHKLGRTPQGWYIVDIDGAATIYRSAALNDLTLTLTSNASVIVSLAVF